MLAHLAHTEYRVPVPSITETTHNHACDSRSKRIGILRSFYYIVSWKPAWIHQTLPRFVEPQIPIPMSVTLFGYRVTKGTVELRGEHAGLNGSEIQRLRGEKLPCWDRHRQAVLVGFGQLNTNRDECGRRESQLGTSLHQIALWAQGCFWQVVLCCIRR